MKFSYCWFKEFATALPKPEKLAEVLTSRAFEISEIQKTKDDFIFFIDILPNRTPDCLGHWGLARELGSVFGKKVKDLKTDFYEDVKNIKESLRIEIKDKTDLNSYHLRMIEAVKIGPSPAWLKKRLKTFGINSINNAVDLANLVMLETGESVHLFDYDKIGAKKIIIRNALSGEIFISLDKKKYNLTPEMLVIADEKDVLAIAGIKGGRKAEVSKQTKRIVIEAANFSHYLISRTSKKLNLITDASQRFSQRISPYFAELASRRLCHLIQKYCGGKVLAGKLGYEKAQKSAVIRLRPRKIASLLGREYSNAEITRILKAIYCKVKNPESGILRVEPPPYRSDLAIEEELIEEIGRLSGYETIKSHHPFAELKLRPLLEDFFFEEKIKNAAIRVGFNEIKTYSFIGEKETRFLDRELAARLIEVQNPFRPEFRFLKPYLIPLLLNGLEEALKLSSVANLFEVSNVFSYKPTAKDSPDLSSQNIAFALAISEKDDSEAFFELKSRLNSVFESLGFGNVFYSDKLSLDNNLIRDLKSVFHPFRLAQIEIQGRPVGMIGEIRPEIKNNYNLKGKIALAEFSLADLMAFAKTKTKYRLISKYPVVMRDIAVMAPKNIKAIEIVNLIKNTAGLLLADLNLFDIYEGKGISANKKSLAFQLIFQSQEKTLTDAEVNKIMENIIKTLEKNPNFEVRR